MTTGCATIESQGPQKHIVDSEPRGAKVYLNDKWVGESPLILDIERKSSSQKIRLQMGNETKEFKLRSDFRWLDSGVSNLFFLTLFPLAVTTDFITGQAWEYPEKSYFKFSKAKKNKRSVVVQAPPQGQLPDLAMDIAIYLENEIQRLFPGHKIISTQDTYDFFKLYRYDFYERPIEENQLQMREELRDIYAGDFLVESFYELDDESILVYMEATDLKENKVIVKHNTSFDPDNLKKFREAIWVEKAGKIFNLFPNNLAISFSNSSTLVTSRNESETVAVEHSAQNKSADGWLGHVATVFNSVQLDFILPPTERRSTQFVFQFVPTFIASWNRFNFELLPIFEGVEFDSRTIGIGYGPQWNLIGSWGLLYLQLTPIAFYNETRWKSDIASGVIGNQSGGLQYQFGYTYFLNKNLNLSIFVQNTSENSKTWQNISDELSANSERVYIEGASRSYGGLSLGYYFSTFENPLRKIYD